MTTWTIMPNWQPIETAPKDGSVVRVAIRTVDTKTGEERFQYNDVFWGKMKSFPEHAEVWVNFNCQDNGLFDDSTFIRQISISDQYGTVERHYHHTGMQLVGWTRPWDVKVKFPSVEEIQFTEKVYDNRKGEKK